MHDACSRPFWVMKSGSFLEHDEIKDAKDVHAAGALVIVDDRLDVDVRDVVREVLVRVALADPEVARQIVVGRATHALDTELTAG